MDELDYYKKPWFLVLAGLAIFGAGYIAGDDNRIEREDAIRVNHVQTVDKDKPVNLVKQQNNKPMACRIF